MEGAEGGEETEGQEGAEGAEGVEGGEEEEAGMPEGGGLMLPEGGGLPPMGPAGAGRGGRGSEVFVPSERIGVDQSVDFPWDI